eukprot:6174711-Pleurochrysis_carterae.AAC.1
MQGASKNTSRRGPEGKGYSSETRLPWTLLYSGSGQEYCKMTLSLSLPSSPTPPPSLHPLAHLFGVRPSPTRP